MFAFLVSLHTMFGPTPVAPLHYKLVNKVSVEVAMAPAPIVLTQSAWVSISMTDSAAGRVVAIVIDSSTFDAGQFGAQMAGQMGDDPKGVTLHAVVVNGRVLSIDPSVQNAQALQLVPVLQLMLGATRAANAGDSWVDSTVADTSASGMSKASLITEWKATSAAAGALQFDGTVTGTTAFGTGAMQLQMQTTGTSHATTRNRQLPSTATSSTTGTGSMSMGAQAMTLKLSTEMSATPIP